MDLDRLRREQGEKPPRGRVRPGKVVSTGEEVAKRGVGALGHLVPKGVKHPDAIITTNPKMRRLYINPSAKAPDGGPPPKDPMELYFGRKKKKRSRR